MFDSVNLRITQDDIDGVDFLSEIPCYLDNVGEHSYNGMLFLTGRLGGLQVSLNQYQVKVKDGSLCKFYLGSNYKTMGRQDTQKAIEKLSDSLHLPMDKAAVTRLDVAQNFITRHPPDVYFNHLGLLKYSTRLQEPSGLYYKQTNGRLCFYDKNKEQRNHGEQIPELYKERFVLRYEQRYTQRIAKQLNVAEVKAALLYDEAFYIMLLNRWRDSYKDIQKINDVIFNFKAMKTKKEFSKMGILSLVEQAGGQMEMITQINDASKRGELTKKQAYDLRQMVNDACKVREGLTKKSDAIAELDRKVSEAVRFYR